MKLDGAKALSWRAAKHALDPATGADALDVTRRIVALRGWPVDLAALAVAGRMARPDLGALDSALESGDLIRSYAFRGGSYVFTPEHAASLLAARTATEVWRSARYQRQAGFLLDDWEPVRAAIREALAAGPATRAEIWAHLRLDPRLQHLEVAASGAGSDTLYKPLHWWGDICFGPSREGSTTFRLLDGDPRWPGRLDVDEAGRRSVELYLGSYAPATLENLDYWLVEGLSVPRRRLREWIVDLGDAVTTVEVDGVEALVRTADLDAIEAAEPSEAVRLLPAFDPWVFGPGTKDSRVISPARRDLATRGSNLVVRGGVVSGTWRGKGAQLEVTWFDEAGPAPRAEIDAEIERVVSMSSDDGRA